MKTLKIFKPSNIIGRENITFGDFVLIDDFVKIHAKKSISIGSYVHIGSYSSIMASAETVTMGDFSGLSFGVRLVTSSDDFSNHGFGNPTINEKYRNVNSGKITIGKFAIIGTNCVVLPGAFIGDGCAVAAGSVVTKSLEPWGIYVGNRRVGERNKDGILKNYETFLSDDAVGRLGNCFKPGY